MRNVTLKTPKECDSIFTDGTSILAAGKKLWLFRVDGSFVATFKMIRDPHKVAFLPQNTALIDGGGDGSYHYISLNDGSVLWSSLKKGRRNRTSWRFAVSPDGSVVYDICYDDHGVMHVDRICPKEKQHNRYRIEDPDMLRVTHDIYCDEEGNLCAFQSHIVIDPDDLYPQTSPSMRQNGILAISFEADEPKCTWKKRWKNEAKSTRTACGCDGKCILREDFSVLDLDTMKEYRLFQEDVLKTLPRDGFDWSYEEERQLLTVHYIAAKTNIVIDCKKREVVGKYSRSNGFLGFEGCLVGNEFWIGTDEGIIKYPFPNTEEVLP